MTACDKSSHLLEIEHILQALHLHGMCDFLKIIRCHAADTVGRRLWREHVRELFLKITQLTHQGVVGIVIDTRIIHDIVLVIILFKQNGQFRDPLLCFISFHGIPPLLCHIS